MSTVRPADRLAVCSWSLRPDSPDTLARQLLELQVPRVQLALDPMRDTPAIWGRTAEVFRARGIRIVSGMFGTVGEDYSTLETIKATGGILPDATWEQNWKNIQAVAGIAAGLGLKLVTFHAGFLPHETSDPRYARLHERITQIARLFAASGIDLGFETGQESADTLAAFLQQLGQPNIGVNFDPANMILYAKGDPIAALRVLNPWLLQCHIKDAVQTAVPGTWGQEVPTGTGQVDWAAFFQTLASTGYQGNLCIEREAGEQRLADIRTARDHVLKFGA
jgi:sugar phosphate isomerase/epimerase